ncbi:epoxide hydrolase [Rhizobium ruizarguesonis]|uniref:epoxide hydrolase family protein n=1 Tax=Rhizobium ruizarguesonis TaxID=2081791 RepID=UPI001030D153|nr:epoxide hydrolase [Rhizobium ruizarguesonis]MBY5885942.1 epoxide hydrolase 1 [Rhizobium leguminosarum]TBY69550.1 epoxide hydrolase [Rhizobium leguminosarum bv. viciae]NEH36830.1 alpha/beta fold hydrolase [Rhizobium ruizarguesonis]NEH75948.1 alpha/beta fold hydrolase [Rhizobium ruizarguesonis]QSZ04056.1 alpha/beta fold hydrolase [Rhizobium ruizarguesonis]
MKKFDNILAWRRLVRGAMVMAVGSMLLFPAGYLVPASAADVTSDGPATPIEADETIRPFQIHVPQSQLDDLRKRIAETRWPDKETVSDASQGIQLSRVQDLVRYWGTDYDWRKAEAELNALPEFITTIDGVDIQFIHVRSRHPNALPVILTHGWPGSTFEFIKAIGPLTDPTAYGGKAEDAFDVVIPSIPGYGFSGKPTELGWGPDRVARAWDILMKRLGYAHYVSQGGDHGSVISDALARQAPKGLLGIHLNMPATVPGNLTKAINSGDPAPAGLSAPERDAYESLSAFFGRNAAYGAVMVTRPQTIGYSLSDSPSGLAAWIYEKFAQWSDSEGIPERVFSKDEMLNDITLYWLTNTGASSSRFYWENNNNNFSSDAQKTKEIKIPVAISVFPKEIYQAPESWSKQAYPTLHYYHRVDMGGHFAAWEQPRLFAEELREAFRSVR